MATETTKLTVRLPKEDVDYAKAYAKAHGLRVTEVIDRYFRHLRALDESTVSSEVAAITGLVPCEADAEAEYRRHLQEKPSQ